MDVEYDSDETDPDGRELKRPADDAVALVPFRPPKRPRLPPAAACPYIMDEALGPVLLRIYDFASLNSLVQLISSHRLLLARGRDVFRRISYLRASRPNPIFHLLSHLRHLQVGPATGHSWAPLIGVVNRVSAFRYLRSLRIRSVSFHVTSADLLNVSASCPDLDTLVLDVASIRWLSIAEARFPSLKRLAVTTANTWHLNVIDIPSIGEIGGFPTVKELYSIEGMKVPFEFMPNLEVFVDISASLTTAYTEKLLDHAERHGRLHTVAFRWLHATERNLARLCGAQSSIKTIFVRRCIAIHETEESVLDEFHVGYRTSNPEPYKGIAARRGASFDIIQDDEDVCPWVRDHRY